MSTPVYVRLDEVQKTHRQLVQRSMTYAAAKVLKENGYDVEVREYFTGSAGTADAASIVIRQIP